MLWSDKRFQINYGEKTKKGQKMNKITIIRDFCMAIYYALWIPVLILGIILLNHLIKYFNK